MLLRKGLPSRRPTTMAMSSPEGCVPPALASMSLTRVLTVSAGMAGSIDLAEDGDLIAAHLNQHDVDLRLLYVKPPCLSAPAIFFSAAAMERPPSSTAPISG